MNNDDGIRDGHETRTDVLVVGGGLGGIAAALAVAKEPEQVVGILEYVLRP